jgi:selenocysteine lyase/cysteine desulfurase
MYRDNEIDNNNENELVSRREDMGFSRRNFLKSLGLGVAGSSLIGPAVRGLDASLTAKLGQVEHLTAEEVARNEDFWFYVQQAFDIDRGIINLNNGGVHPAPRVAMEALHRYLDFANGAPAYNSWRFLRPRKEHLRRLIADAFGCSPEEIAITRNVTESMHIPLLGIDLKPGDEILTTAHDYPSMKNALFQREKREGVVARMFSFPYPPKSLSVLAELFEKNLTPRTKIILICHITNLTGQIFPIREICRMARDRGIHVVIDGAHAFGHFDFKQADLDCDIYGANLHKWIMAPTGAGFLYVKKEEIKNIWPLFPAPDPLCDDIRKFEHYGTHPEPVWLAAAEAMAFHQGIGAKRKEERLRYLKDYWARALEKLPGVKILTSLDPKQACGIVSFTVENMDINKLSDVLFERHKIYQIAIDLPEGIKTIRITPSICTTLQELDIFIEAATSYIRNGLPS